jgi:site-specific DNA-methyltransferase (adenine-specific)
MRTETIGDATLILGDCREVLPTLGRVNCIITDPPYSARTHAGHDGGAVTTRDGAARQALGYSALDAAGCDELARTFTEAAEGWIVWMTDHTLAPTIASGLASRDRYVFAPLPYFHAGRSVRLTGDGPSSWTDWIICARTVRQVRWGTLPGGYVAGAGWNDKQHMGGKPTALMVELVGDYSRHGDLVCDPFMGSGTTGCAAVRMGRRFVGVEIDPTHYETALRRTEAEYRQPRLFTEPTAKAVQEAMF